MKPKAVLMTERLQNMDMRLIRCFGVFPAPSFGLLAAVSQQI